MTAKQKDILAGLLLIGVWLTWALVVWLLDGGRSVAVMEAVQGEPSSASQLEELRGAPIGETQPPGDCAFVWGLENPAAGVPCSMALDSWTVAFCESGVDSHKVGAAGERGILQIHPVHAAGMAKAGLNYGSEADRLAWAAQMWQRSGWNPWSCRP